jgi:hypothetical protein
MLQNTEWAVGSSGLATEIFVLSQTVGEICDISLAWRGLRSQTLVLVSIRNIHRNKGHESHSDALLMKRIAVYDQETLRKGTFSDNFYIVLEKI